MSGPVCDETLCTTTLPHHVHSDADGRSWCCGPYPYTSPAPRPAGQDTGHRQTAAEVDYWETAMAELDSCGLMPSDAGTIGTIAAALAAADRDGYQRGREEMARKVRRRVTDYLEAVSTDGVHVSPDYDEGYTDGLEYALKLLDGPARVDGLEAR